MAAPSPRGGRIWPLCLALVTLIGASAPAAVAPGSDETAAPDSPPTLDGVTCEGLVSLQCAAIEHHLGLAEGVELPATALDDALRRLWDTGLVDHVELRLEPTTGDRARLVATVAERPRLVAISLSGLDRLTRTRVERWLGERDAPVEIDAPLDRSALGVLRRDLERLLAADPDAPRVEIALEPAGPGRVRAELRLVPAGRPPFISEIAFEGAEAIEPRALGRSLTRNRVASAANRLTGGGRLDRAGLEADRRSLRRLYRQRGFKDVEIGEPRVETLADREAVRLVFPVREGPRWKLGGLSVSGNREASDQRLLALYERQGEWLDLPAIEAWAEEIRVLYVRMGRLETSVRAVPRERPGGRVDVVVTVREGPVLRLGRLTVIGNDRTAETTVRAELEVDEGQVLDLAALEGGLARLSARGLFEPTATPIRLEPRRDGSGRVDLTLSGREADPYRVDVGGGWSDTDGLSGHFSLEARNLGGRGVAAGLRVTEGSVRDRVELFVLDPMFRGRRQTASAELFDRNLRLTPTPSETLAREERGLRLAWSRPLADRQSLRLGVGRANLDDRRARDGTATEPFDEFDRTSFSLDWARDTRDDPLRPRRGGRLTLSLLASVDHGIGGRELLEPRAELALFRPAGRRASWAARVEAGRLHSTGATAASPLDAFFLGGPRSVRGFPTASIVARDAGGAPLLDDDGFRQGGDRFLEAAVELRFPLAGPLSGTLFVDTGQVWAEDQSLRFDHPRTAAGIELWLQPRWLPLPLRLTWAHNLDPLPDEEFDNFLLGLGASF